MGWDIEDLFERRSSGKHSGSKKGYSYDSNDDYENRSRYGHRGFGSMFKKFGIVAAIIGLVVIVLLGMLVYFIGAMIWPFFTDTINTVGQDGINGLIESYRPWWERLWNGSSESAA